jgi:plasmid stabilization system protein ParE
MITIRISEDALQDLNEGFWFYESQEAGLGDYFASSLRGDIERLRITAGVQRLAYKDYRRLLSRIFPYAIYYTFSEETAVVWAVVDCRRDPEWIRTHLDP